MIKGIDISDYQQGIDLKAAVADGVKFVIVKFADGENGIQKLSKAFRDECKALGLIVGCYCFGRFWADPLTEADHFLKVTGGVLPGELPLSFDYEWDNSDLTKAKFKGKYSDGGGADAFTDAHALTVLARLEAATNVVPMLYTAPGFFSGKNSAFSRYPLWLNDFASKDVSKVRTPKVWARPTFWQYREEAAYGVSGVDFNYFLGSLEELKAMTKGAQGSPVPGSNPAAPVTPQKPGRDAVVLLQTALNAAGAAPPLLVDGVPGPKTQAAMRQVAALL